MKEAAERGNCFSGLDRDLLQRMLAKLISRMILVFVFVLLVSEASAECVLPGSISGTREFSLPRNSVCLIRRASQFSKHLAIKVTVRPKLGVFGKASMVEMA